MKACFSPLTTMTAVLLGLVIPISASAQNWQRITTEQQFRDQIVDRQILTTEGNTFTSHADGRVTGQWQGAPMVGAWQWHQGFWCRNVRVGQHPETGTNCQVIEMHGSEVRMTRDQGQGAAGTGRLQ